jgi:hypothetical protein
VREGGCSEIGARLGQLGFEVIEAGMWMNERRCSRTSEDEYEKNGSMISRSGMVR